MKMQKIAASIFVACSSIPAFAQSNIQIYGVAEAYLVYGKYMGDNYAGVESGNLLGSQLGFRGEENLGNGLKAIFQLEEGYDISTGKSMYMTPADSAANPGSEAFTRQAFVGLKSNSWQISAGRQYAPGFFWFFYDAQAGATQTPQLWLSMLSNMTIATNDPARWNNSIKFSGDLDTISYSAIYSFGNQETDTKYKSRSSDDKLGFSLRYHNGNLDAGGIYHLVKYKNNGYFSGNVPSDDTQKEFLVGASYDFNMVKLFASYQKSNNSFGVSGFDNDLWTLGMDIPLGNDHLRFSYAQLSLEKTRNVLERSHDPKSFAFTYLHPLSKRTTTYAGFRILDYDNLSWNDAYTLQQVAPDLNGHSGNSKVDNTTVIYLGLAHQF